MEQFTNSPETNNYLSSVTDLFTSEDASTGQRFVNFLIDTIAMYIFSYGAGIIVVLLIFAGGGVDSSGTPGAEISFLLMLIMLCFSVFFFTFSEGVSSGRSIGKLITVTKVVKLDESEITWKDALIRSLCRLVPFEPFSALGGSPWHDNWSNTKVIKIRK